MATTEVTQQSWFSRLGKSLTGLLAGVVLFLAAIALTAWNEGRAVKTAKGLEEGAATVLTVDAAALDPANEGRLVHLSGLATADETLRDEVFGLEATALKLKRTVEMLQWQENRSSKKRNKIGGGTETVTTYEYEKVWSDRSINSEGFKESAAHRNPGVMPLESATFTARRITVGGFELGAGLVARVGRFDSVSPPAQVPEGYVLEGNTLYQSLNPKSPQIGDVRVQFMAAPPMEVSIIARQRGTSLEAYTTQTNTTIELLADGQVPAGEMFASAVAANNLTTWLVRFGGFLGMFFGVTLVLAPLGVLADVLPFLGSIMRFGTSLIAALISVPTALGTIAIAWIAYRPVLGITLIVVGVAIPVLLLLMRKGKSGTPAALAR